MELQEKILLKNGTELALVPMGTNRKDKIFILSVFADLDYTELENILINADNISKIRHLNSVGETLATYTDCIGLKRISKDIKGYTDGEIEKDVYVVELNRDPILAALKKTQKENAELKQQIETLIETIDYLLLSKLEVEV